MNKELFELDYQVQNIGTNEVEPNTIRTTVCWVTKITCKVTCGCNLTSMCTPGCPF